MSGRPLDSSLTLAELFFFALPSFKGKNKIFEHIFIALKHPIAYYLITSSPAKNLLTRAAWIRTKREITCQSASSERFDLDLFLPGSLLRKTDLATMYASLEGRLPFLDPGIMAAAAKLPLPVDTTAGLKPVLKKILARYMSSELVYRPKSGFHLPYKALFDGSKHLGGDLAEAIEYLSAHGLLLGMRLTASGTLKERYPSLCFSLITLYHVLRNSERIYEGS